MLLHQKLPCKSFWVGDKQSEWCGRIGGNVDIRAMECIEKDCFISASVFVWLMEKQRNGNIIVWVLWRWYNSEEILLLWGVLKNDYDIQTIGKYQHKKAVKESEEVICPRLNFILKIRSLSSFKLDLIDQFLSSYLDTYSRYKFLCDSNYSSMH